MSDLAIVVPARNTHASLPRVLAEVPARLLPGVVVVDDGSTPPLSAPGVHLVRHATSRGYGGAQKSGYAAALDRGATRIVMLHGDGQYQTDATLMLAALLDDSDLALGSRFLVDDGRSIPGWRRQGNRLLTGLANRRFGVHLSEMHTGARAYRASTLRALPLHDYSDDYAFDMQLIAGVLQRRMRVAEGPVPVRYDPTVQSISFVRSVRYGVACLGAIARPT